MEASKSENLSFRLTPSMKKDLLSRSLDLKLQPAEYLLSLIEKDLLSKSQELPDRRRLLLKISLPNICGQAAYFFVENIDKKLQTIEQKYHQGYRNKIL